MYSFKDKQDGINDVDKFYLKRPKEVLLRKALYSPEGTSLRNSTRKIANQQSIDLNIAYNEMIKYTAEKWFFNPLDDNSSLVNAMRNGRKTSGAFSAKANKSEIVSEELISNEGDSFDASMVYSNVNDIVDVDELAKDYKIYLKGIYYIAKDFPPKSLGNIPARIMYHQLISTIYDSGNTRIAKINEQCDYYKAKGVNKVVDFYYKSKEEDGEKVIADATKRYLRNVNKLRIKSLSPKGFFYRVMLLLNTYCDAGIFQKPIEYNKSDIDKEIVEVSKIITDAKLNPEFIDNTDSIRFWASCTGNEFDNEYNIEEYKADKKEGFPMELTKANSNGITHLAKVEKYIPTLIFHMITNSGPEAELYKATFNKVYNLLSVDGKPDTKVDKILRDMQNVFRKEENIEIIMGKTMDEDVEKALRLFETEVPADVKREMELIFEKERRKFMEVVKELVREYNINYYIFSTKLFWEENLDTSYYENNVLCNHFGIPDTAQLPKDLSDDVSKHFVLHNTGLLVSNNTIILPKFNENRTKIITGNIYPRKR